MSHVIISMFTIFRFCANYSFAISEACDTLLCFLICFLFRYSRATLPSFRIQDRVKAKDSLRTHLLNNLNRATRSRCLPERVIFARNRTHGYAYSMTRIIVRMHPLCNGQPLARLSTPFSQPRRRRRRRRHHHRQDIHPPKSQSTSRIPRKAYGKTGRQGSRVTVFSFVCPQLRRSYWKQLPQHSSWLLCMRVSRVEECDVVGMIFCGILHIPSFLLHISLQNIRDIEIIHE